jgi:AraC-like DNA-binding protein
VTARAIDLPEATLHPAAVPQAALLPAEAAEKVLAFAAELGVARERLLAAAGWSGSGEIPFETLCALYEEAVRLTGDPFFGLHVGERTSPRDYGLIGYAAANSRTLGDALKSLVELHSVWTDSVGFELRPARGTVALGYWHRGDIPAERRRQESEQMMAALLRFASEALVTELRPVEVRFEHEAPADLTEHARLFAAPIVFSAPATELVLPAALLGLPVAGADLVLGGLIRNQAEAALAGRGTSGDLLDSLRTELRRRIAEGLDLTLADASAALNLGPRTLQRALAQQGLTFRSLADELRIEAARRMLADPQLGLAEIAHRLGFSQPSAFHRAFRRATGTTPRQFRLRLRA